VQVVDGPWFEDLEVGRVFDDAPAVTLTDGLAAAHQAILGNRFRLCADHPLARAVCGAVPASPALVWDVAIGQSTQATRQVIANLFYRGLRFHRWPNLGDTLRTATTVRALRDTSSGRAGRVLLQLRTTDQDDRVVLDFHRCALLPLRGSAPLGRSDDLEPVDLGLDVPALPAWDLSALPSRFAALAVGDAWRVAAGDVVSSAPELARLTHNVAAVHHDPGDRTGRLVYGGHTVGLALGQVLRAIPELVTVVAWESCDHVAPVAEQDTLRSELAVTRLDPLPSGGGLVGLAVETANQTGVPVLRWRFTALVA
jgi:acyl dehydratase